MIAAKPFSMQTNRKILIKDFILQTKISQNIANNLRYKFTIFKKVTYREG